MGKLKDELARAIGPVYVLRLPQLLDLAPNSRTMSLGQCRSNNDWTGRPGSAGPRRSSRPTSEHLTFLDRARETRHQAKWHCRWVIFALSIAAQFPAGTGGWTYAQNHEADADLFVWKGVIEGDEQGTITYTMDGVARSTFLRNRIGFCVLHPSDCAGARCRVEQAGGRVIEGEFPRFIRPDAPFLDIQSMSHEVTPGVWARLDFEGDLFEMEDQRNWVDASFKTFCTPLRLPYPVELAEGTRVIQRVKLSLDGDVASVPASTDPASAVSVEIRPGQPRSLPAIGLGAASHGQPLTERELQRLRMLRPAHLRVDLVLAEQDYADRLRQVSREASALGVPLEAAIFVTDDAETELRSLVEFLQAEGPTIARWLVFHSGEKSTTDPWVRLARRYLSGYAPGVPFYAGTNAYFTELNRGRPNVEVADGVCYSINPQVHAFDNRSLAETLEAHVATAKSARQFAGALPLAITPVTLGPRFNPNATGPVPDPAPGTLPDEVDVRQMSLFGAGWTLGSIKYLAESGVAHATYYETTGWRGVMETEVGSAVPEKFRSLPGSVFPLFHVMGDVAEFAEGEVIPTRSSDPLRVESLMLAQGDHRRLVIANLTAEPQEVSWEGLAPQLNVRRLDEDNAIHAMLEPGAYRADPGQEVSTTDGRYQVRLSPFEVLRIDGQFRD